jgi:hypothetical protein
VIVILCSVVNWYLSLAAVCARSNETRVMAIQRAMLRSGSQTAAVVGISVSFGVLRILAILVAFVVVVFSLGLTGSSPHLLLAWLAVVALAYCALADFLYLCRLAAYASLEASVSQTDAHPPVPPIPEMPLATTSNGHH